MAKPGPKPAPREEQELKGETRPSRVNYEAPEFLTDDIAPSRELSREGYKCPTCEETLPSEFDEWCAALKRLAPGRILTNADVVLLTHCAQIETAYQEIYHRYKESGPLARGSQGQMVTSPLFSQLTNLQKQSKDLWVEFGASPSARTRVRALKQPEKDKRGFKID